MSGIRTHNVSGDRHCYIRNSKSNCHTITTTTVPKVTYVRGLKTIVLIIITVFIHAISYSTMQITKWCGYSAKFTSGLLVGQ
jgi:hypothetical protein